MDDDADRLEKKWADYERRRNEFMRKMNWCESRMVKHEISKTVGFSELFTWCTWAGVTASVAFAFLSPDGFKKTWHDWGGVFLLFIYPIPVIPSCLAFIIERLVKTFRRNLPVFHSSRPLEERGLIEKARNSVELQTNKIYGAHLDRMRYVAPHWIANAEAIAKEAATLEKSALVNLAKREKIAHEWQCILHERYKKGWPEAAKKLMAEWEVTLKERAEWYKEHNARQARNAEILKRDYLQEPRITKQPSSPTIVQPPSQKPPVAIPVRPLRNQLLQSAKSKNLPLSQKPISPLLNLLKLFNRPPTKQPRKPPRALQQPLPQRHL